MGQGAPRSARFRTDKPCTLRACDRRTRAAENSLSFVFRNVCVNVSPYFAVRSSTVSVPIAFRPRVKAHPMFRGRCAASTPA
jgi:hypothetical protein